MKWNEIESIYYSSTNGIVCFFFKIHTVNESNQQKSQNMDHRHFQLSHSSARTVPFQRIST
jgi:hypothetical protein